MDISQLKMKELAEVERLAGIPMSEWDSPTVKLSMAISFVTGRKTNPSLTWDQIENMSIEEMTKLAEGISDPKANIS
jgi:hypothetical protein